MSVVFLGLSNSPAHASGPSYQQRLDTHQREHQHVGDPHELEGRPLYERTWYLVGTIQELENDEDASGDDREIYEDRLKAIRTQRNRDICNPRVSSLFAMLVELHYVAECPDDGFMAISSNSNTLSARPVIATWFDEDGSEKSISQEETVTLSAEAKEGKGLLVVDTGHDFAVVGLAGEWVVDSNFAVVAMAGLGIATRGGGPTIEDLLKLGLALNDPANADQLELLGTAAADQTKGTLRIARSLLEIPKFAQSFGIDPATGPVDVSVALGVVETAKAAPSALASYEKMAKRYPDLGNPLLPLALATHPSELRRISIEIDVGKAKPIVVKKLRPEEIEGWVIRPNKRTKITANDVRSFEIIETRR
jgi:hypothetical protein